MKFYVDWDDPAYPRIRRWKDGCGRNPQLIRECRRDIAEHCKDLINHWRSIAKEVRRSKTSDIGE